MARANDGHYPPVILTTSQRAEARVLWEELMYAPDEAALDKARHKLQDANPRVQQAVMREVAKHMMQGKNSSRNPFDEE